VTVIINDARNFLRRSPPGIYAAVIFCLLDSHTGVSGYTNIRVDNYVYTKESFAQAKHLLKPDGVMVVKFAVLENWGWIGQRLHRTLIEVFGRLPVTWLAPEVGPLWGARSSSNRLATSCGRMPPGLP
jgi:spermidine synthase